MRRFLLLVLFSWTVPMTDASHLDAHPSGNRLAAEASPYLLQHARNPVDWYPWGAEAFTEARRRGVPIFLSVGYSTCYWCHVMERESFEDEQTAALMNQHFVCIKVDREERPAVDDIYMAAVQLTTGRGGWPMSVFLTPPDETGEGGLQPFYAGTYFPKQPHHGLPGFRDVLGGVAQAWSERQPAIRSFAEELTRRIGTHLAERSEPVAVGAEQVDQAVMHLIGMYDSEFGGFGGAPKFPQPVFLELVQEALGSERYGEQHERLERALTHTLDAMALGGMHDQIGGGFHRYSTDRKWLVPHFEKMLYDNGQLALLYADSVERTGDTYHAAVLRRLCDYVLREMTDERGGFYSAQDAEVNHHEGENYLWHIAQIRDLLEPRDADLFIRAFGLDQGTNFQDPHDPSQPPANVLYLVQRPEALAQALEMDVEALRRRLDYCRDRLLEARARREQPGLDDKIIAEWNGLMIAGMARAGLVLGEDRYIEAAQRAADFVLERLMTADGDLLRVCRLGLEAPATSAPIRGGLGDYAAVIMGLLRLYEATGSERTLGRAVLLAGEARARFWDARQGGYYDTLPRPDLIVRPRTTYDGAIPSGASLMLGNLLELAGHTRNVAYLSDARALLGSLSSAVRENPLATANTTRHLLRMLRLHPDLVAQADDPDLAPQSQGPVRVAVDPPRVKLGEGESAALTVRIDIDPGVHINSSDPGDASLSPTSLQLVGGGGVALEVTYPPTRPLGEGEAQIQVYQNQIEIGVTLRRTGAISGEPHLVLTYQACTQRECLAPTYKMLDVEILVE